MEVHYKEISRNIQAVLNVFSYDMDSLGLAGLAQAQLIAIVSPCIWKFSHSIPGSGTFFHQLSVTG